MLPSVCSAGKLVGDISKQVKMYFRPVAGYVNLCPNDISTEPHNLHQMHATLKHEILHALVSELGTRCPGLGDVVMRQVQHIFNT